jgi:uncharacterized protein involved in exopolysaccharide biosynthesis
MATRYGAPAPSGPPMPVQEREPDAGNVQQLAVVQQSAPTRVVSLDSIRANMDERISELEGRLATVEDWQTELKQLKAARAALDVK